MPALGPAHPLPPAPPSALLGLWRVLGWVAHPLLAALLARRFAATDPARLAQHLGHAHRPRPDGTLVWVHAASLGEARAVLPVVERLRAERPDVAVLITTATETGAAAVAAVPGLCHQYLPLDTGPAVRRFLRHWHPDLAVFVEAELWPRLIDDCHRAQIPLVLIEARMSERSARRWARWAGLARAIYGRFAAIAVADAGMAQRLAPFGATPAVIAGPLKQAGARLAVDAQARAQAQAAMAGRAVWAAMSTHPGEEDTLLAAHALLRATRPDALLVLVPRHAARGADIAHGLRAAGWGVVQRSAGQMPGPDCAVWLADTMGEAGLWFDTCPVVFMGGSLVDRGGHNGYEPAAHGAAILHGPHVGNFAPLYAGLDAAGGARAVTDAASLAACLGQLLDDPTARARMADAARTTTAAVGSGVPATAGLLARYLPPPPPSPLPSPPPPSPLPPPDAGRPAI